MKKLSLIVVTLTLTLSCKSDLKSQSIEKSLNQNSEINISEDKINLTDDLEQFFLEEGLEKRNNIINELLTDLDNKTSKLEKRALSNNSRYGSSVDTEKKIIQAKEEREKFLKIQEDINNYLSSKESKEIHVFTIQDSPKKVVKYLFNSFTQKEFSQWKYFLDPYLKQVNEVNQFTIIMSYFPEVLFNSNNSTDREWKKIQNMVKDFKVEMSNVRIDKNKAYVLTSFINNNEEKKHEIIVELINRSGYWFINGISK